MLLLLLLEAVVLLVLGILEARSAFLMLDVVDFLLDPPPRLDLEACRSDTCRNTSFSVPSGRLRKLAVIMVAIFAVMVESRAIYMVPGRELPVDAPLGHCKETVTARHLQNSTTASNYVSFKVRSYSGLQQGPKSRLKVQLTVH